MSSAPSSSSPPKQEDQQQQEEHEEEEELSQALAAPPPTALSPTIATQHALSPPSNPLSPTRLPITHPSSPVPKPPIVTHPSSPTFTRTIPSTPPHTLTTAATSNKPPRNPKQSIFNSPPTIQNKPPKIPQTYSPPLQQSTSATSTSARPSHRLKLLSHDTSNEFVCDLSHVRNNNNNNNNSNHSSASGSSMRRRRGNSISETRAQTTNTFFHQNNNTQDDDDDDAIQNLQKPLPLVQSISLPNRLKHRNTSGVSGSSSFSIFFPNVKKNGGVSVAEQQPLVFSRKSSANFHFESEEDEESEDDLLNMSHDDDDNDDIISPSLYEYGMRPPPMTRGVLYNDKEEDDEYISGVSSDDERDEDGVDDNRHSAQLLNTGNNLFSSPENDSFETNPDDDDTDTGHPKKGTAEELSQQEKDKSSSKKTHLQPIDTTTTMTATTATTFLYHQRLLSDEDIPTPRHANLSLETTSQRQKGLPPPPPDPSPSLVATTEELNSDLYSSSSSNRNDDHSDVSSLAEEEEDISGLLGTKKQSSGKRSTPSPTIFRRQDEKEKGALEQQDETKEETGEEKDDMEISDGYNPYLAGTDFTSFTQDTSKADDHEEEYDEEEEESNINQRDRKTTLVSWDNEDSTIHILEEEHQKHRKRRDNRTSSSSILRTTMSELTETDAATFNTFNTLFSFIPQSLDIKYILYLSTYAIIGSSIRSFLARFFGLDCESSSTPDDFVSSTSSSICVTSTKSAIFIDLPANILGCFIMGIMTTLSTSTDWPPMPCFKASHSVQSKSYVHVSLKTGLCGSLTTFASWNSQMVKMMGEGGGDASMILSAVFGYVIGLQCAIGSFSFGARVSTWLNRWKNPSLVRFVTEGEEVVVNRTRRRHHRGGRSRGSHGGNRRRQYHHGDSKTKQVLTSPSSEILVKEVSSSKSVLSNGNTINIDSIDTSHNKNNNNQEGKMEYARYILQEYILHHLSKICYVENIPFLIVSILLLSYIISDVIANIPFYRFMWLSSLLTPPGALLRWKLSKLNGTIFQHHQHIKWIPFGTFLANLLGSLISIALVATHTHLLHSVESYTNDCWGALVLNAAKVGFAGSLSTVSTYVKEIVDIRKKYPQHAKSWYYGVGSIGICCCLSLVIYCPVVRSI